MTDMEDTQRKSDICTSGQQIRWSFFCFFHFSNEEADVCEGEGLQGQKPGIAVESHRSSAKSKKNETARWF